MPSASANALDQRPHRRLTRVRNAWDVVHTSYWFAPVVGFLAAVVVSWLAVRLDDALPNAALQDRAFIYHVDAADVRPTLQTIITTIISVFGLVFSIALVPFTIVASQYGPILLRNFLRDTGTQVVLGWFAATSTFTLLALLRLPADMTDENVPQVTVTIALAAFVVSLGVLIYFFHHTTTSLQATTVTADVHRDLERAIEREYPTEGGLTPEARDIADAAEARVRDDPYPVRAAYERTMQALGVQTT